MDSSIIACRTWLGESKHHPALCIHRDHKKRVLGSVRDGGRALRMLPSSSPVKSEHVFETWTPLSQPLLKNSITACPGTPVGRQMLLQWPGGWGGAENEKMHGSRGKNVLLERGKAELPSARVGILSVLILQITWIWIKGL